MNAQSLDDTSHAPSRAVPMPLPSASSSAVAACVGQVQLHTAIFPPPHTHTLSAYIPVHQPHCFSYRPSLIILLYYYRLLLLLYH